MKIIRRPAVLAVIAIAVSAVAVIMAGLSVAQAAAPSPVHHAAYFACFGDDGNGTAGPVTGHPVTCPSGSILAEDNNPGPAGAAGPSGVTSVATEAATATLPAIGGSFTAGHTVVKAFTLPAGTYQVTLTGDFYKTVTTTATPVLQIQLNGADHQLTGYTAPFPFNAAEATGAGADGTPNGLEQTAIAEGIVTMAAAGTVEVDAFGYNPDRGAEGGGDFAVRATVGIVKLTPAG